MRNASGFSLRLPGGLYLGTAWHVVEHWINRRAQDVPVLLQLADTVAIDPQASIAWRDEVNDIVFMRVTAEQVARCNALVCEPLPDWPPPHPMAVVLQQPEGAVTAGDTNRVDGLSVVNLLEPEAGVPGVVAEETVGLPSGVSDFVRQLAIRRPERRRRARVTCNSARTTGDRSGRPEHARRRPGRLGPGLSAHSLRPVSPGRPRSVPRCAQRSAFRFCPPPSAFCPILPSTFCGLHFSIAYTSTLKLSGFGAGRPRSSFWSV